MTETGRVEGLRSQEEGQGSSLSTPLLLPGEGESPTLARQVEGGWRDADPWPMGPLCRAALRGLVRALCPSPEGGVADTPPLAEVEDPVSDAVRRAMRYMELPLAIGLQFSLVLLDWSPLWRFSSLRPLHCHPPKRAAALLQNVATSRVGLLRGMVMGARAALLMQWYDLPEVHAHLNYDPVSFMRSRVALRARLLDGGASGSEDLLHPLVEELPTAEDLGSGPGGAT